MDDAPETICGRPGFLHLPFAEQFLIWAVRVWVAGRARGQCPPAVLQEGLSLAGAAEAWPALDALLWTICRYPARRPDVHGVRCLCLGRDEAMLIRAAAAAQKGRPAEARRELETLLPPEMAQAAGQHLQALAHSFLCAGLCIGKSRWGVRAGRPDPRAAAPRHVFGEVSRSIH